MEIREIIIDDFLGPDNTQEKAKKDLLEKLEMFEDLNNSDIMNTNIILWDSMISYSQKENKMTGFLSSLIHEEGHANNNYRFIKNIFKFEQKHIVVLKLKDDQKQRKNKNKQVKEKVKYNRRLLSYNKPLYIKNKKRKNT